MFVSTADIEQYSSMGGGGRGEKKTGELFIRATQHSPAVQMAAVHVFVTGLVINTLDAAAHPAKPIHVAAESREKKDGNVKERQSLTEKAKITVAASNGAKKRKEANKMQAQW